MIPNTGLAFTLAGDFGVSEYDRALAQTSITENGQTVLHQANPLYNAYFGLSWTLPAAPKDGDGDGIVGKADLCPKQAEDKDGFKDDDGCPDYDNDNDGVVDPLDTCPDVAGAAAMAGCPDSDRDSIADYLDKCVNQAEDRDGFQDVDGCPDGDNDNDGVADSLDKCATVAGVAANNGCPDADADGDGSVDRLDKCIDQAEDQDGFKDDDGCPEADNDGDGILDSLDKCPNNPGVAETQGCPKTKEITRGALILKGVTFESAKAVLKPSSGIALDEMALSLREWPEVMLEIQGHTDNIGDPAFNQTLSQQRADAVRQYLIEKGIDPARLTAKGYGQDKPIADNKTSAGRAQNRRVEINRVN
jgi:outer membrane protein OmpA-like peptidoglycan-associated protein